MSEWVSESVSQSVTQQLLRRKENISSHHRHDQIKEDETGGACSMPGRDQKLIQNFGYEFFSKPPRPERLWGPSSFLSNG
jgi:hypothetical protein